MAVSLMVLFGIWLQCRHLVNNTNFKTPFSEYGFPAVHVYSVLEVECTVARNFLHCREVVQEYLVLPSCFLMGNISVDTDSSFHNYMLSNYQLYAHLSRFISTHSLQFIFNKMITLFTRLGGFQ